MLRLLIVAAAVLIGFWLARRARNATGASRALAGFTGAALANHVLLESLKIEWLAAAAPLITLGAALAGLLAWAAVAWLVHLHPRRRDPFFRIPLFAVAAITGMAGAPWGVSAGFACAAIVCFRWKDRISTKALFQLGLLAIALSVLLLARLPGAVPAFAEDSAPRMLLRFSRWSGFVTLFYAIAGVIAMFAAFVRDPTLGLRRVGRRLSLSHLLVVLVPLGLTLILWAVTTIVGVGSERARVAARALEAEGTNLAGDVALSIEAGAGAGDALRRAIAARAGGDQQARAWSIRGGRMEQVFGEAMTGDSLLLEWFAAADSVPRAGLLGFGGRTWIGAISGDRSRGAAAIVPANIVVARVGSRFTGGRVKVLGRLDDEDLEQFDQSQLIARAESLSALKKESRARAGATPQPRTSIMVEFPDDTIRAKSWDPDSTASDFFPLGQTTSLGASRRSQGWRAAPFVVAITLDPRVVLGEIFSRARQSDLDIIPLVLVLFFGGLFALVAIFDLAMVVNMGRSITAAIGALRRGATQLEAGDLAHRIPVKGDDELWDVARAFNHAVEGLERAREFEKERDRLESELALARRIQSRLLPEGPPTVAGWDIAGASESARQVGGDYYDHIDLGGGRIALVIADVSGKGVPAALLMSAFRAALVSQDLTLAEPSTLTGRLNHFLHGSVEPGRFVTAFVAFLDTVSGRMVYVNAGHNPPYVLRVDGSEEALSEGGTILGSFPASAFIAGDTVLHPGDLLALYTDGVTEGANAEGEMWGEERLVAALRRDAANPARDVVQKIVDEVREFEGESGPADDITMLLARRDAPIVV